ncbi:GFA family protein [Magnetovibrio sp.]|uniref:GFA family protein n=1 Tax=Magnetovibrio sp. TaxID=2024836 RepID=UPI002F95A632
MTRVQKGSCLCGHVAFTVEGAPNGVTNCHCRMCQKASGAPYVTWVELPRAAVQWSGAEPAWRTSSRAAMRGFCPACGTPVAFVYNEGRDIDLPSVLFDDPEAYPPRDETWTESRRSWTVLNGQLPHHRRGRDDGEL